MTEFAGDTALDLECVRRTFGSVVAVETLAVSVMMATPNASSHRPRSSCHRATYPPQILTPVFGHQYRDSTRVTKVSVASPARAVTSQHPGSGKTRVLAWNPVSP